MKILIAAACIAVLAGVGYYFVQEYRSSIAAEAARQEATVMDGCLFTKTEQGRSLSKMREYCIANGYIARD